MKNLTIKSILLLTSLLLTFGATAGSCDKEGKKLMENGYDSTQIGAVEEIRLPIRSSFEASYKLCKDYIKQAKVSVEYNTFYKSVEGKSEDEIKQAFNKLPKATQDKVKAFESSNSEMLSSIGQLLLELAVQQVAFDKLDAKSALSDLSMFKLPSALSSVGDTGKEIMFINDSMGEIYKVSQTLSALENAS